MRRAIVNVGMYGIYSPGLVKADGGGTLYWILMFTVIVVEINYIASAFEFRRGPVFVSSLVRLIAS